jgi:hypothetical protein
MLMIHLPLPLVFGAPPLGDGLLAKSSFHLHLHLVFGYQELRCQREA